MEITSLFFDLNYKFELTGASLIALAKSIFHRMDQTEPIVYDPSSLRTFVFVENKKMLHIVNGEEIGVLEEAFRTKASESLVWLKVKD